jgi:antitoxin HicB
MHYSYPVSLERDEKSGAVTAYFDGLPGATWGETREQALAHAKELLTSAIEMLLEDGEPLPPPTPAKGRPIVETDLD